MDIGNNNIDNSYRCWKGIPIQDQEKNKISLTGKITNGFIWIFAGTMVQTLFKFIVLVVLARLLSPEEFGIAGAAAIVITFAQILSQLGIGQGIVQRKDLTGDYIHISAFLTLFLGIAVTLLVFISADLIASFFKIDELGEVVRVVALIFPISAASIVSESLIQREMKYKNLAAIETLSYVVAFAVIGIALAMAGWGVWSLIFALISQATIKFMLLYICQPYMPGLFAPFAVYKDILKFGANYSAGHIANHLASQLDNIVVGRYLGAEILGYYTRAYQAVTMPTKLVGRVAHMVLFPVMSSVQSDLDRLQRAFMQSIGMVGLCSIPITVLFCLLAEPLVLMILGDQWGDVVVPFQILSVAILFRVAYKVCESLSRAKAALIEHAIRQWVFVGAVFLGAWVGHFWGLNGVATGVSISIVINYLLMLQLCKRLASVKWSEIGFIHLRHFSVALVLGAPVWFTLDVLENFEATHFSKVMICGVVMTIVILLLAKFFRRIFGPEGLFLVTILQKYLPSNIFRFLF